MPSPRARKPLDQTRFDDERGVRKIQGAGVPLRGERYHSYLTNDIRAAFAGSARRTSFSLRNSSQFGPCFEITLAQRAFGVVLLSSGFVQHVTSHWFPKTSHHQVRVTLPGSCRLGDELRHVGRGTARLSSSCRRELVEQDASRAGSLPDSSTRDESAGEAERIVRARFNPWPRSGVCRTPDAQAGNER